MTRHRLVTVAVAVLALVALSQTALAQERYEFNIPFSFMANGKNLPAGDYYLSGDEAQQVLTVESKTVKANIIVMPIEARTAESKPQADAELVFDKSGDTSSVAELLPPGQDGYVVLLTKGAHTHHSVTGTRAKK